MDKVTKIIGCIIIAIALVAIPILTGISWCVEYEDWWIPIRFLGTAMMIGYVIVIAVLLYYEAE